MIVDATDLNHVELVRQRLADEGIDFPNVKDLVNTVERFNPRIFNYFSLHGKQIYISSRMCGKKRYFCLYCVNFNPAAFFGINVIDYNRHSDRYLCYEIDDFDFIFAKFVSFCRELLFHA